MDRTGQGHSVLGLVCFVELFFFSSCFSRLPLPGGNKIGFHFRPGPAVFLRLRLRNTATAGNYFERNALRYDALFSRFSLLFYCGCWNDSLKEITTCGKALLKKRPQQ